MRTFTTQPGWTHDDSRFQAEFRDGRGQVAGRITDEAVMLLCEPYELPPGARTTSYETFQATVRAVFGQPLPESWPLIGQAAQVSEEAQGRRGR